MGKYFLSLSISLFVFSFKIWHQPAKKQLQKKNAHKIKIIPTTGILAYAINGARRLIAIKNSTKYKVIAGVFTIVL